MIQTDQEKFLEWLDSYPGWEDTMPLNLASGEQARMHLLPVAMEETSRVVDMLGNSVVTYRYKFALTWQMAGVSDDAENARRLLAFQKWVHEQNGSRSIPRLGSVPGREQIRTEKGGYTLDGQFVFYNISLIAEYAKEYPER